MSRVEAILRIHVTGDWPEGAVGVERVESTWRAPAEVEEQIERAWREATARPGVHLFDGRMCRLESWDATAGRLRLSLSETTYKRFLGTNLTRPHLADRYGRGVLANPVGVSPALLTADGFLMMGRRNASVAYYPERVHPFAGALDPGDGSPFEAVRRELREELSFGDADVVEVRCTGIAEDLSIRQPELILLVRSGRRRAEVEGALDGTEHRGSWHLVGTEEAVGAVLREPGGEAFTPVALASLLLYGRVAFGEGFFSRYSRWLVGE
jgi:8-oxo-dGTP pyrophosphatase MutT (NUDIX family)